MTRALFPFRYSALLKDRNQVVYGKMWIVNEIEFVVFLLAQQTNNQTLDSIHFRKCFLLYIEQHVALLSQSQT